MQRKNKNIRIKCQSLFYAVIISFLIGIFVGCASKNEDILNFFDDKAKPPIKTTLDPILIGTGEINTCFTPPSGCGLVIANLISKAQESIYVQAYSFTSGEITHALINAHKRGVKVKILLDKSNIGAKYSRMQNLIKAGIEVYIDHISGIAHNKVIIIDNQALITGSFNFTVAADVRNAENIIIVNDKQIAERYLQNWFSRKQKAKKLK